MQIELRILVEDKEFEAAQQAAKKKGITTEEFIRVAFLTGARNTLSE